MVGNNVVAIIRASGVRKLRRDPARCLSSADLHRVTLDNDACLSYVSCRVRATTRLFIQIVEDQSPKAAALGPAAYAILREALDHAVRNPQTVAALPVHAISRALQ